MPDPQPQSDAGDAFYVGYLAPPPGVRRVLATAVAAMLVAFLAAGAIVAVAQRDPGPATWDVDREHALTGTLRADPYPMVVPDAGPAVLLVGPAKQGATGWVGGLAGRRVAVRGNPLVRGDLRFFSVADEPDAVRPSDGAVAPPTAPVLGSSVTLAGEIVDPKCFGGAMKPGDGKAHKACAALCIRGGIPPVLVTPATDGSVRALLLVAADGGPLSGGELAAAIDLVAERVRVTGVPERTDGLDRLRVAPGGIAADGSR